METEYESDHTKFMRELFKKNPQLPEKQLAARGMWWDKKLDREENKRFKESNVPQKPYVYFGEWLYFSGYFINSYQLILQDIHFIPSYQAY